MSPPLMRDVLPRHPVLAAWERQRNKKEVHWIMECFAEMLGVFLYCYLGMGATAGFIVGNILKLSGFSSLLQVGLGYGCGIALAIIVTFTTSGGHLTPGVTITMCLFKGFPKWKAVGYIVAQILGGLIASALVYNQWKVLIDAAEAVLKAEGAAVYAATQFTPTGPAGIFAFYLVPGQTYPRIFLTEFVNCTVLGLVIWATLDPTNLLVTPTMFPFVIALAYSSVVWGFAVPGISLNTARDIGGRIFAVAIWGPEAAGGPYAAIAALVNIPAILFAAYIYEIFLADSSRVVPTAQLEFHRHLNGHGKAEHQGDNNQSDTSSQEKADIIEHIEHQRV